MEQPPPTEDAREAAQIAYWNDATAANWVALEERIDPVLAPLSTLALERALARFGAALGVKDCIEQGNGPVVPPGRQTTAGKDTHEGFGTV